ncbi:MULTISPECIES: DUF4314 domain-containing protein [unclassified Streptomyces]|uniref:DUF4314 domain-containing protein n=1 Tax=unclassified Streptomyces TaxID=2593676 RepID=UPI0029A3480E|nr:MULTISPECIES: DUF4314 domain-containing protein [unclassified Streptomyces]MDX3766448.1 DUF4314 domain-containing protein [Streptomyces sp. AK08-01B]MDX3816295.1 DUF4314 domain-containing protein [Streptomyces sp. AK08-01A]WSA68842.1 DUF4314 domain-containing protein [Streptomyces sp. NBC_01800]
MYRRGQRIALIATADPHTELRPGAEGTVRSYDNRLQQLKVTWDDGSRLSMLLDDGDEVSLLS